MEDNTLTDGEAGQTCGYHLATSVQEMIRPRTLYFKQAFYRGLALCLQSELERIYREIDKVEETKHADIAYMEAMKQ